MHKLQPAMLAGSSRFPAALLDAYAYHRQSPAVMNRPNGPRMSAPAALANARADVAAGKVRYPAYTLPHGRPFGGVSWQPGKPGIAHVENPESHGFREVGRVLSEPRYGDYWETRGFGGWFTRPGGDYSEKTGDGLCWGVVYMLPGRKGETRFVAGYQFGETDGGPTLDLGTVYTDPRGHDGYCTPADLDAAHEAARAANGMAESAAEREREYQTAWRAGSDWAELGDDIREAGKRLNAMVRECKGARQLAAQFPAMADAIRGAYADLLGEIREARAKRHKLAEGEADGLYFWPGDKDLIAAFNDGAGKEVLK